MEKRNSTIEYSVVIPAYNEADKIVRTLTQVVAFMDDFAKSYEVLVVDDGSADNTAAIVEGFSKENQTVRLIRNRHKGKGPTVWTGVMKADGEYIYMADADLATPISELKKLSLWIKEKDYDIVIASREGSGALRVGEPFYRHLMGRVFNKWVQIVALPGIKDSQCGFKLFKKNTAKEIFKKLAIYGKETKEIEKAYLGAFDVEVLYLAKKLKKRVKELPVTWSYVATTRLNPISDSINMAKDVFIVRINDLRGKYK